LVQDRLAQEGLKAIAAESEDAVVLGITTTQERLEWKAQAIRLLKKRNDTHIVDAFDPEQKENYYDSSIPYRDATGLFSLNDWSLIVHGILEDTTVLPAGETSSELSRKLESLNIPLP
jgi:hypothetical protein